jgi:tetratricopeptide (TPR) repeat protein
VSAERWQRLRRLYEALSNIPAAARDQKLAELRADRDLHAEVLAMLAADDAPDPFLDPPKVTPPFASLLPGTVLCDRFVVERILGQGGMGEVWAARDRQLGERVAIKTIHPSLADQAGGIARFKREIQLARRIGHPNVCRVYELFEDTSATPSRLFLTMELLEGETLGARLFSAGSLSTREALDIFRQITAGLAAAHDLGVVHRDLKPANIMIATGGRTVLMDFGLARLPNADALSNRTTQTGALIGTPEYMAPEQISGAAPTPATDIYALGLILFEMLRGRPPFAAGSTLESWMRRAREGPERLSGVVPGVQRRIDTVIERCLQYEPAKRFRSARDVWDALQSPWTAVVARNRAPVIGTAAVLVIALVAAAAWGLADRLRPYVAPPVEALQWFDEAQRALAEGASVRALNGINRAIAAAPRFTAAHVARAEILLELDTPGRAQEAMLKAAELTPNRNRLPAGDAAYFDGIQQLLLRDCDKAIASLERVANGAAVQDRPFRLIAVARAMERCGRTDAATKMLAEIASLDPRNAAAPLRRARLLARSGDYDAATAALATAETLFRDRNNSEGLAEVLATRGTLAAERDLLDEAAVALEKASSIADTTDDVRQRIRVFLQQAIVSRKRGQLGEADALTSKAIDVARLGGMEPLTLEGLFASANVHIVSRQPEAALPLIERALTIAETYRHEDYQGRAHLALGSLFLAMSDPDRAEPEVRAGRTYFARIGHARNVAAADAMAGQIRMMRAEYTEAIAQFGTAVSAALQAMDPEQEALARENLATAQAAAGHYTDALAEYARVVFLRREAGRVLAHALGLLNMADLAGRLGRFSEAARLMAETDALRASSPDLASRKARVAAALAVRRGDHAAALAASRRARESSASLSPERRVRIHQDSCTAYAALGQRSRAVESCDAMLTEERHLNHLGIRAETRLTVADAYVMLADPERAREAAREAAAILLPGREHHERWKLLAIQLALKDVSVAPGELDAELERHGKRWGKQAFESWRSRADVRRLLRLAQVRVD